jgi:hypothetical protein
LENKRAESYWLLLEEKEYEAALWDRVKNASEEELALLLTSPLEEERWIANWYAKRIKQSKKNES